MSELSLLDYIELLRDGTPDERRNAAWMLGRQRDTRIIEPLIAALPDADADVRLRVTEALGNIRDESIVPPLLTALSEDVPRVRAQVAISLGNQRDYRTLEALVALLRDGEAVVRAGAIEALYHLPDGRAIAPLIGLLADEPDEDNRHYAARTLTQIGGLDVVNGLIALLLSEPDSVTKIRCIEIIGTLRYREGAAGIQHLLEDEDDGVRQTAEWALKQLGAG